MMFGLVATTTSSASTAAVVTPNWPSGCNGSEVWDWTQGMSSLARFYRCVSGGKTLTSANYVQCQLKYCGHYPPTDSAPVDTSGFDPWSDPAAGGPSCQVLHQSFKVCANGAGRPWMYTAVEWNDPSCTGGWCWHGVGRFSPDYSIHLWDHVRAVWHNTLLRKCTAALLGATAGTFVVVVTEGAGTAIGYAIIGGTTSGCVTGAFNYWFGT
jgi:hypothetical protein